MRLQGLFPPLVTPLHDDYSLDHESMLRQAESVLNSGADGLWLAGTTGEFHALGTRQVGAVVRTVVEGIDAQVPVIAQIGAPATSLAVERAEAAQEAGATALAAVTPFYLEYSPDELAGYYRAIHAAVSLPLFVYHLPAMTKVTLDVELVLELARDGIVAGVKDSSATVTWLRRLVERAKAEGVDLSTFTGGGGLVDLSVYAGASGAMCAIANVVPAHCTALVAAARNGEHEVARALQSDVLRLEQALGLDLLSRWTPTVSIFKAVLMLRGLIATDACVPPGRSLDRAERSHLAATALPLVERMEGAASER